MNVWLDLFTGRTFDEFKKAGANVSGFRHNAESVAQRIKPGDLLVCYVTGISRFVGILKVQGKSDDSRPIWSFDDFPVRLAVTPELLLDYATGIPLDVAEDELNDLESARLRGLVRRSPNLLPAEFASRLLDLLRKAHAKPVTRPFDKERLERTPRFVPRLTASGEVANIPIEVPTADEQGDFLEAKSPSQISEHTDAQGRLLELGHALGLQTWVASNDRSRPWKKGPLGRIPGLVDKLPIRYDEATNRTIELIDVLWLRKNTIVGAFESSALRASTQDCCACRICLRSNRT